MIYPRRIESYTGHPNSGTAMNWWNIGSTPFFGFHYPGYAVGDNQTYKVLMEAGTWALEIPYTKSNSNGGICTPYLDGVALSSFDTRGTGNFWYAATGISVAQTGIKTLELRVTGPGGVSVPRVSGWSLHRTDVTSTTYGSLSYNCTHFHIVPWMSWDGVGGHSGYRLTHNNSIGSGEGGIIYDQAELGDWTKWNVALDAGTWTIGWMWRRDNLMGKFDVTLGGTTIATFDAGGGGAFNQENSYSNINVSSDGIYELKFTSIGLGTSSTDYQLALNLIMFRKS